MKNRRIPGFILEGLKPKDLYYVFRSNKKTFEFVGTTAFAEDAAALLDVSCANEGVVATRFGEGFRVLWSDEDGSASDSYDAVARVCEARLRRLFGRFV